MGNQEHVRLIKQFWSAIDRQDFEAAAALLHDEYVEEWPQSGERIRGRDNFIAINKQYPQQWQVTLLRVLSCDNQVVSEVRLDYLGELVFAISFFTFKEGKIVHETDYWPEPYEPPTWREAWVER